MSRPEDFPRAGIEEEEEEGEERGVKRISVEGRGKNGRVVEVDVVVVGVDDPIEDKSEDPSSAEMEEEEERPVEGEVVIVLVMVVVVSGTGWSVIGTMRFRVIPVWYVRTVSS